MMVEARCYQNDSWSARRVIGATAKPLCVIDRKTEGFVGRVTLWETIAYPAGYAGTRSARPRGLGGDFEFLPLKSPRNPITPIETSRVATLHPELYKNLREGARRVIGATAKPLYPIDGKAGGLDRRNPRPPSSREGDRPQTVEGVFSRRKAYSFPKLKYMCQNAEPCAGLRRILLILYLIRCGQSIPCLFRAGTSAQNARNLTNQTVRSPLR